MKALITGASSGMGRSAAKYLSSLGYDLILVSRSLEKLENLKKELKTNVKIYSYDLSIIDNVFDFYEKVKDEEIDLLINNAGFGLYGEFCSANLETEINMIDLNIKAYHILTKLFLTHMIKRNKGNILNVVSIASLMPGGPLLSTYYATKSYILSLDNAIYEELRKKKSNVHISSFCPGPVETNFNKRANTSFMIKGLDSDKVMKYAIKKALKNKLIIIPDIKMRILVFCSRFLSKKSLLKILYKIQIKKKTHSI
ncbi:MAG: SDR family oxidoreductase [Bacilli bacterium]|nr:SDR family oxidoreductase [Bacilli bacterium]